MLVASYSYVPSSPILVTLMMEALSSSETSVLTRATWHNISENATLHSHRREKPQILQYWRSLKNDFVSGLLNDALPNAKGMQYLKD
jgi:hypothetical protein